MLGGFDYNHARVEGVYFSHPSIARQALGVDGLPERLRTSFDRELDTTYAAFSTSCADDNHRSICGRS